MKHSVNKTRKIEALDEADISFDQDRPEEDTLWQFEMPVLKKCC